MAHIEDNFFILYLFAVVFQWFYSIDPLPCSLRKSELHSGTRRPCHRTRDRGPDRCHRILELKNYHLISRIVLHP